MIEVTISKKKILVEGHASEKLICNTVSVLMWSLSVSLNNANAKALTIKEGYGYHSVEYEPTRYTKPIYEGICESFRLLSEQFPTEVKIFSSVG